MSKYIPGNYCWQRSASAHWITVTNAELLFWQLYCCEESDQEEEDKPQGFNVSRNTKHCNYDCFQSVGGVFHKSEEFLGLVQTVISHTDSSAQLLKPQRRETLQNSAKQLCQTALNPITNVTTWAESLRPASWFVTQRSHWSQISRAKRHRKLHHIYCKTEQCFTRTHYFK